MSVAEAEKCTRWQPNERMLRLLDVFWEQGYDVTVKDACEEAKISRRTYYNWEDDPDFMVWWNEKMDKWFIREKRKVYVSLVKAATEDDQPGSDQARRTFLERFDKQFAPRTRQDIDANVRTVEQEIERLAKAGKDIEEL